MQGTNAKKRIEMFFEKLMRSCPRKRNIKPAIENLMVEFIQERGSLDITTSYIYIYQE